MILMIFSTVRAPQEPALTVESLAISATGRPSTSAVPVMTPSAGRPSARALAYRPSSVKLPSSTRPAIRARANSLPAASADWWYRGAPPCSTRSRSPASPWSAPSGGPASRCSATWGAYLGHRVSLESDSAGPGARPQNLGRQLTADDPLGLAGRLDHRLQVHAGRHAHVLDHVHELLGGDVAGSPGRVRAAAEPADRGVEVVHAQLQRGQHVGQAGAPGVVEVQVQRGVGVRRAELPDELGDPARGG